MAQRGRKSAAALAVVQNEPEAVRQHPDFDPPPPHHLGNPEAQIWRDVLRDYSLTAHISAAVLATALEAHQRAREAREIINREGMIVACGGKSGKLHPLLAVERDAR